MGKKKADAAGDTPKAAKGCVLMTAPEGSTGCSHEGIEYGVEDGMVEVPAEIAPELAKHGFTVIE